MKFDIAFHIVKAGVNIAGYLTAAPMESTEDEAKAGFNKMQSAIARRELSFFVIYPRDQMSMLGNPEFRSVLMSEVLVTEEFYKDAIVNMQLFSVPDVEEAPAK